LNAEVLNESNHSQNTQAVSAIFLVQVALIIAQVSLANGAVICNLFASVTGRLAQ